MHTIFSIEFKWGFDSVQNQTVVLTAGDASFQTPKPPHFRLFQASVGVEHDSRFSDSSAETNWYPCYCLLQPKTSQFFGGSYKTNLDLITPRWTLILFWSGEIKYYEHQLMFSFMTWCPWFNLWLDFNLNSRSDVVEMKRDINFDEFRSGDKQQI